jgi:hypothetical protein
VSKFKVGDRVRYTGNEDNLSPRVIGHVGTVCGDVGGGGGGTWDSGEYWTGYFPGNLELIQPTLTATDRLERLEAFVAKVAAIGGSAPVISEAKGLVAEIAPPVDDATAYVERVFSQIGDGGPMSDEGVKSLMKEAFEAGRANRFELENGA